MSYRLGADGYAFAKIDPVPTTDNDKKTVSLTFFIEPGNRVYVRHINFNDTTAINDETLRREMRQLEGGWLSNRRWNAPRNGCSGCRTSRKWNSNPSRSAAAPIWSTWISTSRRVCPASSAAASAIRNPSPSA